MEWLHTFLQPYQEYIDKVETTPAEESTPQEMKKETGKPKQLSKEGLRSSYREGGKKRITAKEEELEEHRSLRFEPEYYHDYQKMNELNEKIDDIHNELAHLYEEWEQLNS